MDLALTQTTLDIFQLHTVIDNLEELHPPRRQGRTTAFLYLMLGEMWLGDPGNSYLYVGENRQFTEDTMQMFVGLLKDEGINASIHNNKLFIGDKDFLVKTIHFLPITGNEELLRGQLFNKVYIDILSKTKYNNWEKVAFINAREIKL